MNNFVSAQGTYYGKYIGCPKKYASQVNCYKFKLNEFNETLTVVSLAYIINHNYGIYSKTVTMATIYLNGLILDKTTFSCTALCMFMHKKC